MKRLNAEERALFLEMDDAGPLDNAGLEGGETQRLRPRFLTQKQYHHHATSDDAHSVQMETKARIENWNCIRANTNGTVLTPVSMQTLTEMAELLFQHQLKLQRTNTMKQAKDGRFALHSVQNIVTLEALKEFQSACVGTRSTLPAFAFRNRALGEYCYFGMGEGDSCLTCDLDSLPQYDEDSLGVLECEVCLVLPGEHRALRFPCLGCGIDFDSDKDLQTHVKYYCRFAAPNTTQKKQQLTQPLPPKTSYDLRDYDSLTSFCGYGVSSKTWVVKRKSCVLPVALLRYTWTRNWIAGVRPITWAKEENKGGGAHFYPLCTYTSCAAAAATAGGKQERAAVQTYWGLTIPLKETHGRDIASIQRHLILDRASIGSNKTKWLNEIAPSLNAQAFDDVTLFGASMGIQHKTNLAANFFTSSEALDFFFGSASVRGKEETVGSTSLAAACHFAVCKALDAAQREHDERVWDELQREERARFTPNTAEPTLQQPIDSFLRSVVTACADHARNLTCKQTTKKQQQNDFPNLSTPPSALQVFVLVLGPSDGHPASLAEDEARIDEMEKYLRGSMTKTLCKLVSLSVGQPLSSNVVLPALACWAALNKALVHYDSSFVNMPNEEDGEDAIALLFANIKAELDALCQFALENSLVLTVPNSTPFGDGFVVSADLPPVRQLTILLENEEDEEPTRTLFFATRGETPPPIYIYGLAQSHIPIVAKRLRLECAVEAAQNLCQSARLAAGRGRNVQHFIRFARMLGEQQLATPSARAPGTTLAKDLLQFMRRRKLLVGMQTNLRETLNDVSTASLAFASNAQARAEWICKPLTFKYGAKMLKRSQNLSHAESGEEESAVVSMAKQELGLPSTSPQDSLLDLLYTVPLPQDGVRIKIVRTDASAIDPYLVKVLVVSGELLSDEERGASTSAEAMQEIDLGTVRKDVGWQMRVPDVLLLEGDSRQTSSVLFKAFHAAMLTRNPSLQVPGQYIGLTLASFVRACEQLMKWRDLKRAKSSALPDFLPHNVLPFIRTTQRIFQVLLGLAKNARLQQVLRGWKLADASFAAWIGPRTEENTGVASVAEAVCVACLFPEHSTAYKQVALVAEAVARQARIVVRKRRPLARRMVRRALGMDVSALRLRDDECKLLDIAKGFDFTTQFFSQPCQTNCSVWAVVASLGLAPLLMVNPNDDMAIFLALAETDRVSMQSFLQRNLPASVKPRLFQIALFCQAFDSITREERAQRAKSYVDNLMLLHREQEGEGVGGGMKKLLEDLAAVECDAIKLERAQAEQRLLRQSNLAAYRAMAHSIALAKQAKFYSSHCRAPRIFLPNEIAQLNLTRAGNDQLELDPGSGLLRHHCCFETCPLFLVNLATKKDLALRRRDGLFQHLSQWMEPSKEYYVNELHLRSKAWIVSNNGCTLRCSQEEYLALLRTFLNTKPQFSAKRKLELIEFGRGIYERWERALRD